MANATVDENRCKGCGLCTTVCPRKLLELDISRLNRMGYHPAQLCCPEKCTGCASCAIICPDVAILVEK